MPSAGLRQLQRLLMLMLPMCTAASRLQGGQDLLRWLRTQPHASVGPLRLGQSTIGEGVGVFLTKDVEENEILFEIPSEVCISFERAISDQQVGEDLAALAEKAGGGGCTVALAGYLAKSWLCGGSDFEPYLNVLPSRGAQTHVLWWTDDEVARSLSGAALEDAVGLRAEVSLASRVLQRILTPTVRAAAISRGDFAAVFGCDAAIAEAVSRAFVCILSRSFSYDFSAAPSSDSRAEGAGQIDRQVAGSNYASGQATAAAAGANAGDADAKSDDDDVGDDDDDDFIDDDDSAGAETLVPLLDLLQHGPTPSVRHRSERAADSSVARIVVRARRDLPADHELLNQYLDPCAPEHVWLTRFGFVPDAEQLVNLEEADYLPTKNGKGFG